MKSRWICRLPEDVDTLWPLEPRDNIFKVTLDSANDHRCISVADDNKKARKRQPPSRKKVKRILYNIQK